MSKRSKKRRKTKAKHQKVKKTPLVRVTIGPFVDWKPYHVPKTLVEGKRRASDKPLNRLQRDYLLGVLGYPSYIAYLNSPLWAKIRVVVLSKCPMCRCSCGRKATQVHHRAYTEANLLGERINSMVALSAACHHWIEFDGERKVPLYIANRRLKILKAGEANSLTPSAGKSLREILAAFPAPADFD